jgi:hypothetical protein
MAAKLIRLAIWMCGAGSLLVAALLILFVAMSRSNIDIYLYDRYFAVPTWQLLAMACVATGISVALFRIRRSHT